MTFVPGGPLRRRTQSSTESPSVVLPSMAATYLTGLATALTTLFVLGMFLGKISRQNALIYAAKTLFAGVLAIGLSFIL